MATEKKPHCFVCSLNPWLLKGLLVLPFAGIALGAAGIFTDVGNSPESPDSSIPTPTVTLTAPSGLYVTFTPTPAPEVESSSSPAMRGRSSDAVPGGGGGISLPPIIIQPYVHPYVVPDPGVVVTVITVVVPRDAPVNRLLLPVRPTVVPSATPVPTATPCWPPGRCWKEKP